MQPLKLWLSAILILCASSVGAFEKKQIYASGDWRVYDMDFIYSDGTGQFLLIPMCVAETKNGQATLSIGIKDRAVFLQVLDPRWRAGPRTRNITLSADGKAIRFPAASQYRDAISNLIPASENGIASLAQLAATGAKLVVSDARNIRLGTFSGKGFKAALDRAAACSRQK